MNIKNDTDILIIGGGVIGCAIARELSRYELDVLLVDKCEDVCCGTSKANSAIVHAGYDALPGSLKAKLNVRGSEMMEELCRDLDVPYKRCGSLVVCTDKEAMSGLNELYERGIKNGVRYLEIIDGKKAHEMEPNLSDEVCGALHAPTAAIICPFNLTYALAENAAANGASFMFDTEVTGIRRCLNSETSAPLPSGKSCGEANAIEPENPGNSRQFTVKTSSGDITCDYIVNAAGVYADVIHNMVSSRKLHITPRRGDYMLCDHTVGGYVGRVIFQLPTKMGKGCLVTPTVHGNLLIGPTALDVDDREGVNTTAESLNSLAGKAAMSVKNPPMRSVITSFAGLRAHEDGDEFVIGWDEEAEGFMDAAGIESPGLSSAPAIGEMVAKMVADKAKATKKADFIGTRAGILNPTNLSIVERNKLIAARPEYGRIICRCESITEGEIIDAIRRPVGAKSIDGVKRRTRAGMGRCQGGFCSPKVMEIISRELNIPLDEVTKSGGKSRIAVGRTKGGSV